ncbi:class I SAM-dependent DNA methyltransferase [Mucilaginibacter sp. L196]|uniref:HsdM family class I SAM-dependent methyltransferase n=1 Tax=Mucilaginibacter sp. L196 TaxID=1641870 RepID=UPI00131C9E3B|nr:N-6 DNA methylase [Mucilaginibacter sp. L196]
MANERKTENIVRKHFSDYDLINIEEQKSDNPKIHKLLKNASKKGLNHGYPEFIISFEDRRDFLIVIECKGDPKKHESITRDKYSEYSVDGVLLYGSFLSKEFDVLCIAVSGETAKELKVSHFLYLKDQQVAIQKFGNKLLSPSDYVLGYLQSPEKFRQDYSSLLSFSKDLNEYLHTKKVKESQRSLLISGILIALENKVFKISYKQHSKPEDLAIALVNTIATELQNANLHNKKLANLKQAYGFISTHTALSTEDNVLEDLISDIDDHVNNFIKTHRYFDVLGQFYIEFLRYANSDKGLGIVLTPPHITELFCDLAGVNKDSIVLDNCTGTGGFLISAMNKMIKDSNEDTVKIKSIKEKQLIGIEYQDDIFALACSNMYIHQDGKTNIIHGSCFDPDIISQVKLSKPNIGLLNPPYKNKKKKSDTEELLFILNNLEMLQTSGTCVAIIPMDRALSTKGVLLNLKTKLLENHTLEAVFSMPDELFINSKVGVITVVMVLTAHKPHPKNKETYFGYWKNDGFIKRKNRGRIDFFNSWSAIKENWLNSYINRKEIPGLSVKKVVTPLDEWCAEAYMETDYNKISPKDFINSVKKFVLFKKLNDIDE